MPDGIDEEQELLDIVRKLGGKQGLDLAMRALNLHNRLIGDPKTARTYGKQIKELFPDVRTTDDVAAPYVEEATSSAKAAAEEVIKNFLEEREKERKEAEAQRLQGDFNASWADVVKRYSLTAEGEEKLAEHMKKNNIGNPEAAALHYYDKNPLPKPVEPNGFAPQSWQQAVGLKGGPDDADLKALHEDPVAWADREAVKASQDYRAMVAQHGGTA